MAKPERRRRDTAAVWLFAARLQSVAGLNRAKPRSDRPARSVKRCVWLELRPARQIAAEVLPLPQAPIGGPQAAAPLPLAA